MARKHKNPDYPKMSQDEKAAYLLDARRRGGKTRCAQESMHLARSKGWHTTIERYPFASGWLSQALRSHNQQKGDEIGLTAQEYRRQRIRTLYFVEQRLYGEQ